MEYTLPPVTPDKGFALERPRRDACFWWRLRMLLASTALVGAFDWAVPPRNVTTPRGAEPQRWPRGNAPSASSAHDRGSGDELHFSAASKPFQENCEVCVLSDVA